MEILLTKAADGTLRPLDAAQAELLKPLKADALVRCEIKRVRNPRFLRKFMALVTVGFEAFEPPQQEFRGLVVEKSFDRFRKDLVIAAGYYTPVANFRGDVRAEPKSLSFASMDEAEFNEVYNAVANVLLQSVLVRYTRVDLDRVVNQILGF
ncbi:DUF1367 family protein [Burkholderia cenocepacia]|uniref:DUF1367 family protein n=1 Tax=Burkholderia cenocepacia TaxID=95486 RepID=UPI0023B9D959|nr:DUF1367 family protein [Burkholderia cenocepacia]MDF0506571.1 DUF1367 family protein [Burkholderia cenocepacia]